MEGLEGACKADKVGENPTTGKTGIDESSLGYICYNNGNPSSNSDIEPSYSNDISSELSSAVKESTDAKTPVADLQSSQDVSTSLRPESTSSTTGGNGENEAIDMTNKIKGNTGSLGLVVTGQGLVDQDDMSDKDPSGTTNSSLSVGETSASAREQILANNSTADTTADSKAHSAGLSVIGDSSGDSSGAMVYCLPVMTAPSGVANKRKRPLTDDEIFSKPNRHVYNGYCPCCD